MQQIVAQVMEDMINEIIPNSNVIVCGFLNLDVELIVTGIESSPQKVYTSYDTFQLLYDAFITEKEIVNSIISHVIKLPKFPSTVNDATMTQLCVHLNEFLKEPMVVHSVAYENFIMELSTEQHLSTMTAIDFVLQPFQYEKIHIARGSLHQVELEVVNAQSVAVWKFQVEEYDIDFSVVFIPKQGAEEEIHAETSVHRVTRYDEASVLKPVAGTFCCPGKGTCILQWDNSYSRLRGKSILYLAEIISENMMDAASEAADDFADKLQKRSNSVTDILLEQKNTADHVSSYTSYLSDTGSWLVNAASSTIFGNTEEDQPTLENSPVDLQDEMSKLNSNLMERIELLEDDVAKAKVESDQVRSTLALTEQKLEIAQAQVFELESQNIGLQKELQRNAEERKVWAELQTERDYLLIEKRRWGEDGEASLKDIQLQNELSPEEQTSLQSELYTKEADILRIRTQLGYAHILNTANDHLEMLAEELVKSKKLYDTKSQTISDSINTWQHELQELKRQKKLLITAIRNLQRESQGQISTALAQASAAKMVNRRLKKQNDLLLAELHTAPPKDSPAPPSPILYTLNDRDLQLLQGKNPEDVVSSEFISKPDLPSSNTNKHRDRLVAFLTEYDPSQLDQVEVMLESYQGVEESLFQSLELKYIVSDQF